MQEETTGKEESRRYGEESGVPVGTEVRAQAGLIEKVVRFYHKALKSAQKARAWLKRRQLDDEDLADHFQLGAANGRLPKTLPTHLPGREQGDGEEPRKSLQALGILTPAGAEFFHDCLIVPLLDADGGLISLAGCPLSGGEDRTLPAGPTALWNAPAAKLYPELLLACNLPDGLTLQKAGFPHACAVAGSHLKPLDMNLLHDAGVGRIILLGAAKAGKLLLEQLAGFAIRFYPLSVNEFLVHKGLPELVAEVDRLISATSGKAGDGRLEPHAGGFTVSFGRRRYEVIGIEKHARRLKLTLKTERFGKLHVDTLDLYHAKSRKTLLQDLCCFFEEVPQVIDGDIVKLIKLCEEFVPEQRLTQPWQAVSMSEEERQEAEAFGKAENLMEVILQDFATCGLVGEEANKLLCYLAAVSRKTECPISVLILSSSGAGKSTLQDTTLLLCPPEDVIKLTSLTGKALFYKGAKSLKHKLLALEEEAGAQQASYAIRNLISAGELIIETTVKDLGSGRMTTMQNRVEGPTAVFLTTTNPEADPETRSRFFVTGVDESREQTRAVMESQRRRQTLAGWSSSEARETVVRKHRNFQRLLKPVALINPYAEQLVYADDRLQSRRDQQKYLNLINAVAFLRQMQKQLKSRDGLEYVEVDETDLRIAHELAEEILGRSLDDLNMVSRDLLRQIERLVEARVEAQTDPQTGKKPRPQDIAFTRRDIREYTGWPHTRVARYLKQLLDMEFVVARSGRTGWRYIYTLAFESQAPSGPRLLCGMPPVHLTTTCSAPDQSCRNSQRLESEDVSGNSDHLTTKG